MHKCVLYIHLLCGSVFLVPNAWHSIHTVFKNERRRWWERDRIQSCTERFFPRIERRIISKKMEQGAARMSAIDYSGLKSKILLSLNSGVKRDAYIRMGMNERIGICSLFIDVIRLHCGRILSCACVLLYGGVQLKPTEKTTGKMLIILWLKDLWRFSPLYVCTTFRACRMWKWMLIFFFVSFNFAYIYFRRKVFVFCRTFALTRNHNKIVSFCQVSAHLHNRHHLTCKWEKIARRKNCYSSPNIKCFISSAKITARKFHFNSLNPLCGKKQKLSEAWVFSGFSATILLYIKTGHTFHLKC